jgi:hypothetical protein
MGAFESDIVQSPLVDPIGRRQHNPTVLHRDEELHGIRLLQLRTSAFRRDRGFGALEMPVDYCRQTNSRRRHHHRGGLDRKGIRRAAGIFFWRGHALIIRAADIDGYRHNIRHRLDGAGLTMPEWLTFAAMPESRWLTFAAMPESARCGAGWGDRLGYTGNYRIGWAANYWRSTPLGNRLEHGGCH